MHKHHRESKFTKAILRDSRTLVACSQCLARLDTISDCRVEQECSQVFRVQFLSALATSFLYFFCSPFYEPFAHLAVLLLNFYVAIPWSFLLFHPPRDLSVPPFLISFSSLGPSEFITFPSFNTSALRSRVHTCSPSLSILLDIFCVSRWRKQRWWSYKFSSSQILVQ